MQSQTPLPCEAAFFLPHGSLAYNGPMDDTQILAYGRQVIEMEAKALGSLELGRAFTSAVRAVAACKGRVVVSGIGKAGLIGGKISATLASTGTPSIELHPTEAFHGDLGRLDPTDIFLALSNSGETEELLRLLPAVRRVGCPVVAITAHAESTLAKHADHVLEMGRIPEACPLGMAPSTSTTAMLALGDALALAVSHMKNFTLEDFARFHPGGSLGLRLTKVGELMRSGEKLAVLPPSAKVREALLEITRARSGVCLVVEGKKLAGLFSDGDLRRTLTGQQASLDASLAGVMTRNPTTMRVDELAASAAHLMKTRRINQLPVVGAGGELCGLLDVQDLLDVGLL